MEAIKFQISKSDDKGSRWQSFMKRNIYHFKLSIAKYENTLDKSEKFAVSLRKKKKIEKIQELRVKRKSNITEKMNFSPMRIEEDK